MAVALTTSSLPLPAFAAGSAVSANSGTVTVQKGADHTVTIGNGALSRTLTYQDNKLKTTLIDNKSANKQFVPTENSKEFVVRLTKVTTPSTAQPQQPTPLDQTGWTAETDSEETQGEGANNGFAACLIDNNANTIWHTAYNSGPNRPCPHYVIFGINGSKTFQAFSYTPRPQGENVNGNIKGYKLYVSNNETKPANDTEWGTAVAEGEFIYNGANPIYVNLSQPQTARWVKFVATSSKNNSNFAGGVEFDLYATAATVVKQEREFTSQDLTLTGEPAIEDTTATINGVKKTGKKVTFTFAPFTYRDVTYTIKENLVMYNGDHYMRKFLDISVPAGQAEQASIDYLDLESLGISTADMQTAWTVPHVGGIVQMDEFKANLGQPIYVDGMFFGCEFPAADNQIEGTDGSKVGHLRYYTGKNFNRLKTDKQAAADNSGNIHYTTWQTVAGAATSTNTAVVQQSFFKYIKDIATPSEFRIQYNSWFDNMMNITDENIHDSFIEVDSELSTTDTRPLESYVVDDGWNVYAPNVGWINNNEKRSRSGSTANTEGFWQFNSKFPQGLTPSSQLVQKFGSNFGVWIGPRGGYNYNGDLANIIQRANKGSNAGGSIDVADRTYVTNFKNMVCTWQEQYGVNYWKWDGFADNPQYNAFNHADGVAGYAHNHMTGGYNKMYHVTDLWEAWIDLFEDVRANAVAHNIKNLWLSLTCYVNPSPWYLQWANSVWIQDVYDQTDAGAGDNKLDKQLNYRDAMYYDFIVNHQFQFPLSNVYNHDPIYGKEGTGMNVNTATDEQFQNYLYTQSGRGTAFWELYFSDSIMTPGKWEVTSEFLSWAEANHHMLANAKMFGGSPASNAKLNGGNLNNGAANTYGFSAFDGQEGIVVVRNPATNNQTITYKFDETNGVPANSGEYNYYLEHTHNRDQAVDQVAQTGKLTYGQSYTWTLKPGEVLIFRVSKKVDTTAPAIQRAYVNADGKLIVRMNEKVMGTPTVTINNTQLEAGAVVASADDASFHVTLPGDLEQGARLAVSVSGVTDLSNNATAAGGATTELIYHKNGVVVDRAWTRLNNGVKTIAAAADSLDSASGFTVYSFMKGTGTGALVSQAGGYELGISADGTPYFKVGEATATVTGTNAVRVNDDAKHSIAGVEENNGMLKLYVDGQLVGSAYNAANQYGRVPAGNITLGSAGYKGHASAKVLDVAYAYDEIAKLHAVDVPDTSEKNLAAGKVPTAHWTSNGAEATVNRDRPLGHVTDGLKNIDNYVDFGEDGKAEGSYLQLDLGDVYVINKLNLWRYFSDGRTYENTVIELSETPDFTQKTTVFNADTNNVQGRGAGSDTEQAETNAGRSFVLSTPANARYVRLYMHGRANNQGNTNHVVELEVWGRAQAQDAPEIDVSALDVRVAALNELLKADTLHTPESVTAAQNKVIAAAEVADCPQSAEAVAAALGSLDGLEDTLVVKPAKDNPDEPTTDPDEPKTDPAEPTTKPDQPTTKPGEPTTNPDKPTTNPDEPKTNEPQTGGSDNVDPSDNKGNASAELPQVSPKTPIPSGTLVSKHKEEVVLNLLSDNNTSGAITSAVATLQTAKNWSEEKAYAPLGSFIIEGDLKDFHMNFNVGKEHAGKVVKLFVEHADGQTAEKEIPVASDGTVLVSMDRLSIFTLALKKASKDAPAAGSTGSTGSAGVTNNTAGSQQGGDGTSTTTQKEKPSDAKTAPKATPQTSDPTNLVIPAALAVMGLALAGASQGLRSWRKKQ